MIHKAFLTLIYDLNISELAYEVDSTTYYKVFNGLAPEDIEAPFVSLYQISSIEGTQSAYAKQRMQVSIYSETYDEAKTIACKVCEIANQNTAVLYNGTYWRFNNIKKISEAISYEENTKLYGLIMDFYIDIENQ